MLSFKIKKHFQRCSMSKDDVDKSEPVDGGEPVERDTEVTSPPDGLLQQSRRSDVVLKKEAPDAPPPLIDPQIRGSMEPKPFIESRYSNPPSVSLRMGSVPGPQRKSDRTVVFIAVGLVAFLLGFIPFNIYFEKRKSALAIELSDAQARVSRCGSNAEGCVDNLSECIRDFEFLSGSTAPLGLAPRDFLVEKKRKKKDTALKALSQQQEQILDHLEAMKKPKARSRKRWKSLQDDAGLFRQLIDASRAAEEAYHAALRTTITPTVRAADAKMTKRNKKRAAYLKKARTLLSTQSQGTPTP
jgi:hypothetical protein